MTLQDNITSTSKHQSISKWLYWFSIAMYFISLVIPAYQTDHHGTLHTHYGLEALLLGPIGLFTGHFSWVANPLLWASWVKFSDSNSSKSFILAFIALPLAGLFLIGKTIAVGILITSTVGSPAGFYPYHATEGFYVWIASILLAVLAATLKQTAKTA